MSRSPLPTLALAVAALLAGASSLLAQASSSSLQLEEELRFAVIDPSETRFPDVGTMTIGPDGSLYLGLHHLRLIRRFDAEGSLLQQFGGPGRGEGTIGFLEHLGWTGDTLYVADGFGRLVYFDTDGRPRGDLDVDAMLREVGITGSLRLRRVLPGARAVFLRTVTREGEGEPLGTTILSGARRPATLDTLLWIPRGQRLEPVRIEMEGRTLRWNNPYGNHPLSALSPQGTYAARLLRPDAERPDRGEFELLVVSTLTGDTVVQRGYVYEPEPLDRDVIRAGLARSLATSFGLGVEEMEAEMEDRLVLPRSAPPVLGVLLSDDGDIWIRRWRTPGFPERWEVLNPDGSPGGIVDLPRGVELLKLRGGAIFATADEDGTRMLLRYRLVPSGG